MCINQNSLKTYDSCTYKTIKSDYKSQFIVGNPLSVSLLLPNKLEKNIVLLKDYFLWSTHFHQVFIYMNLKNEN